MSSPITSPVSTVSGTQKIRVGVIGVGRGMSFAHGAVHAGMELVALCDTWESRLVEAGKKLNVATYTDYDRFLEHDMDAVVLANFFHQHAPFAIKALQAGKHVMSETSACGTIAEGVALARAVEASDKVYMIAENYCFIAYNQEMRRRFQAGEIGAYTFGECEYVHPGPPDWINSISIGSNHWRNWLPATYYCTHALAPIMYITDSRPRVVTSLAVSRDTGDDQYAGTACRRDPTASMLVKMDTGAVTIVNGLGMMGHGNWYRVHGSRGLMENLRVHGEQHKLRIVKEPWLMQPGDVRETIFEPEFPIASELAKKAGHGGGDFFTNWHFAEAIRNGTTPYLDVYRAVEMTVVGILGWRSCLAGGAPQVIPDFRDEAQRKLVENDTWSPWPEDHDKQANPPPPSISGFNEPSASDLAAARKVWASMGYTGE